MPATFSAPNVVASPPNHFEYSHWRHGGWYVHGVRYPSGACGCVSRNYADRRWRIACDERGHDHTYPNRDAAALAEWHLAQAKHLESKS